MVQITKKKFALFERRYRYQILACLVVHIVSLTHGVGVGWISPTLKLLKSDESPLGNQITIDEASWMASMIGLGYIAGTIVFGLILERIGRKLCLFGLMLPAVTHWILIYTSENVYYLYAGRFLAGVAAGGMYTVMPIFVSEIADTDIRGALASASLLLTSFGILMGIVLASFLEYRIMPYVAIVLPIIFIIAMLALPETPQYLLKCGKLDAAENAYRFYKNMSQLPKLDSKASVIYKETPNQLAEREEFEIFRKQILEGGTVQRITMQDIFNRRAFKTFGIILVLITTNQFSGSFAIFNYMSIIFVELGNRMDANICNIIVGAVQIVGNICTLFLIDRYGRRVLFLTSAAGMGLGFLGTGLFKQFATPEFFETYDWLPIVLISFVAFMAAIGVGTIIFVVIVELLPAKLRSVGASTSMVIFSFCIFLSLKIYPLLLSNLGVANAMYITAGVSFSGLIVLSFIMPETKGKSMAD